jgi:uncharacterized cupredoxin-like copper-binding protein
MRRQAPLRWLATVVAVVTLGTFALSACGNDDDNNASATTTTALTGTKAACRGVLDADRAAGENDPSGGGDSDQPPTPAQGKAFATALQPHVDQFVANAPADIKDTATQIKATVDSAATSGDITHLDPSDETFGPLYTKMETWVHDTCSYQNLDVSAVDYEFQGMPGTVKAGPTSILFANHAKDEFHELNVMRVNEDASMSVDEIMAAIHKDANAAEQQIDDQVTFVANTGAPPGQTAATTTSLTKGEYLIACFVPVGGKDGAPPHAQMGMMQRFTVG